MNQELIARWEKQIKKSRYASWMVKFRIFLTFLINPLLMCFLLYQGFDSGIEVFIFLLTTVAFILMLIVYNKGLRKYNDIESRPNLKVPSKATAEEVQKVVLPLMREMKISQTNLKTLIQFANANSSPSIVENREKGVAYLLLPLGFLKLLQSEPEVARAMLAHELSHVRQQDTRLWLTATAYGQSVLFVQVPAALIVFVVMFVYLLCVIPFGDLDMNDPDIRLRVYAAFGQVIGQGFASVAAPLAFYYSVSSMRRKSEARADLGAAAFTGVENVKKALTPYLTQPLSLVTSHFLMHPSAHKRFDNLTRLETG